MAGIEVKSVGASAAMIRAAQIGLIEFSPTRKKGVELMRRVSEGGVSGLELERTIGVFRQPAALCAAKARPTPPPPLMIL